MAKRTGARRPPAGVLRRLLLAKTRRRRTLARLPIEEKVRIMLEMQKLENDIRRKTGRKPLREWTV